MNDRAAAVEALQTRIGHLFADRDLLERALTHASVGDGAKAVRHNERLEFLGDRVLNLCAAERLMALYPDVREGEMSRLLSGLVNYHACARVARRIGLSEALRLSASATKVGARKSDAVLGDACEALIAAIYLDGGLAAVRRVVLRLWEPFIQSKALHRKDSKTFLQEWALANALTIPGYRVVSQEGPHHAPNFAVEVQVHGRPGAVGQGSTKRAAEQAAATAFLEREGIRRGS